MQFRGLATDIDGTLTDGDRLPEEMQYALREARRVRPDLVLIAVSGRSYDCFTDGGSGPSRVLEGVEDCFDAIVCDNGGTVRFPRGSRVFPEGKTIAVGEPIPQAVFDALAKAGVDPLWQGLTMLASTTEGNDPVIRSTLRRLKVHGIRRETNKNWVMYQSNRADGHKVDKSVGLRVAAALVGVSPRQLVGTGDGENDLAFMRICGLSVALANAKPELKAVAKLVHPLASWRGTRQVLASLVGHDLIAPEAPGRSIAA
jgi:hydroxymethylpyrimidine pyrophosphatase-like HAD family hydrolase